MPETLVTIAYLAAGLLFIFSLGGLSAQESARRGNLYGIIGMTVAVLVTAFGPHVDGYSVLIVALVIGGAVGATLACARRDDLDAAAGGDPSQLCRRRGRIGRPGDGPQSRPQSRRHRAADP